MHACYTLLRHHRHHDKIQKCSMFSGMYARPHLNTHSTHTILSDVLLFGLFYSKDASLEVFYSYISVSQTHQYLIQRHVVFQIKIKIHEMKLGLDKFNIKYNIIIQYQGRRFNIFRISLIDLEIVAFKSSETFVSKRKYVVHITHTSPLVS